MIHQVVHSTRISAHVKEIPSSFPVSSGTHHRAKENAIGASTDATVFEEPKEVCYEYVLSFKKYRGIMKYSESLLTACTVLH